MEVHARVGRRHSVANKRRKSEIFLPSITPDVRKPTEPVPQGPTEVALTYREKSLVREFWDQTVSGAFISSPTEIISFLRTLQLPAMEVIVNLEESERWVTRRLDECAGSRMTQTQFFEFLSRCKAAFKLYQHSVRMSIANRPSSPSDLNGAIEKQSDALDAFLAVGGDENGDGVVDSKTVNEILKRFDLTLPSADCEQASLTSPTSTGPTTSVGNPLDFASFFSELSEEPADFDVRGLQQAEHHSKELMASALRRSYDTTDYDHDLSTIALERTLDHSHHHDHDNHGKKNSRRTSSSPFSLERRTRRVTETPGIDALLGVQGKSAQFQGGSLRTKSRFATERELSPTYKAFVISRKRREEEEKAERKRKLELKRQQQLEAQSTTLSTAESPKQSEDVDPARQRLVQNTVHTAMQLLKSLRTGRQ